MGCGGFQDRCGSGPAPERVSHAGCALCPRAQPRHQDPGGRPNFMAVTYCGKEYIVRAAQLTRRSGLPPESSIGWYNDISIAWRDWSSEILKTKSRRSCSEGRRATATAWRKRFV